MVGTPSGGNGRRQEPRGRQAGSPRFNETQREVDRPGASRDEKRIGIRRPCETPVPAVLNQPDIGRGERLGAQTKATAGGSLVAAFVLGSILVILVLARSQPLDSLARPTPVCKEEIEAVTAIFLAFVVVMQPAEDALARSRSPILSLLRFKVEPPTPVRVVALAAFFVGFFAFAFWATTDVLGGDNGFSYSFFVHPILSLVYDDTVGSVPYLSSLDKGTQASLYLCLAMSGVVILTLDRGIGGALKDALTLFAAPCLVVFELALWNYASNDMTWHVTDFLWMGGVADGGHRGLDTGGAYLFSNWLVLCVALYLVASRIPWMSLPSRKIWWRDRPD
jgi:hypothetical protein